MQSQRKSQARRFRALQLESLEIRSMMTVAAAFANGVLTLRGSADADTIIARQDGKQITIDGLAGSFTDVARIVAFGKAGNDTLDFSNVSVPVSAQGGSGNDRVFGGSANDFLYGGDANAGFGATDDYFTKAGDFNGDGKADLLQLRRTTTGEAYVWLSNGPSLNTFRSWGSGVYPTDARATGVADLNDDGRDDLWQVNSSGQLIVRLSTGSAFNAPTVWGSRFGGLANYLTSTGDFNGDGRADLWQVRKGQNGSAYVWLSTGTTLQPFAIWGTGFGAAVDYQTAVGDFNADGKSDLYQVRKAENGSSYVWLSQGNSFAPFAIWGTSFGATNDYQTDVGDFNGDGASDLWQVRRGSSGTAYVWRSNGSSGSFPFEIWGGSFGGTNHYQTHSGDFNGDGKTDLTQIANDSTAAANVWTSNGTQLNPHQLWLAHIDGSSEYQTLTADFDGDKKTDLWQVSSTQNEGAVLWLSVGTSFDGSDDDYLIGGDGNDNLFGNAGNDDLRGGVGHDRSYGNAGNDLHTEHLSNGSNTNGNNFQDGGAGDDTLEGGTGGDTLRGGSGNDRLFGFEGADQLFGQLGIDELDGGRDSDSLIGGLGNDNLKGGLHPDRFLQQGEDTIVDLQSEDARIHVVDEHRPWTEAEVETLNTAFGVIVARTRSLTLLKLRDKTELKFSRFDTVKLDGISVPGINKGKGLISIANPSLHTILQQIGHNWDTQAENRYTNLFRKVSRWTNKDPGAGFTKVTKLGETWWYLTSSAFISDEARSHPEHDFAESFAAYFTGIGIDTVPKKKNVLEVFLDDPLGSP